jgi:O-antigen ligase
VFAAGIVGLFKLESDPDSRTSPALMIPVAWMAIGASRMVSQWFSSGGGAVTSADQYLEGSPFDRMIVSLLLLAGLAVLSRRASACKALLRLNPALLVFFGYCLLSVVWSDFPAVAFKRWTKGVGNLAMVLIVLTDDKPEIAAKRLLAWTGFVLIPMSILVIKYYPEVGRGYDKWTGTVGYIGITEGKNSLGGNCLIFGLIAFWSCLDNLKHAVRRRPLIAYASLLGMTFWLFWRVNSSTSLACFLLGASLITTVTLIGMRRPWLVHVIVIGIISTVTIALTSQAAFAAIAQSLGRDTSLTGRTELWVDVFKMPAHPLFGAGYESFFLGDRLDTLWEKYWWHPNEAHNGYIEIYLNLGWIGIGLLATLFITGYKHIVDAVRAGSPLSSLTFALLIVTIPYNMTETAFKVMHPLLISFLLASAAVPRLLQETAPRVAPVAQPKPVVYTPFRLAVPHRRYSVSDREA